MGFLPVLQNQNWTRGMRDIDWSVIMTSQDVKAISFGIAKCECMIYDLHMDIRKLVGQRRANN